jgi:peptide chain release factor 2
MNKELIQKEIADIETAMAAPDFWSDKVRAQAMIKQLQELKDSADGLSKYDRGNAVVTIFSGAGGDDAEDWSAILLKMYSKYAERNGYGINILYSNQNTNGGLVRISPFNANSKRQTSFSMVEVIPQFDKTDETIKIPPNELEIESAKASGPGGQNVNKRETAVRIVHIPTKLSVFVSNERSQAQNKEKALEILKGKLYALRRIEDEKNVAGMSVSKTSTAEWGSQIRSYVLHPYKLVKDHRTGVETSDISGVLDGEIDIFIDSMKK